MKLLSRYGPLAAATLLTAGLWVQAETPGSGAAVDSLQSLPSGITLPVRLFRTLHAGRIAPGLLIRAATTQRVPLGGHTYLPSGVVLEGKVVATEAHSLTLLFDTCTYHGHSLPIATHAPAVASFVAVAAVGIPANGSTDRGNPSPANWTTAQVGGDQVMRSGWSGPLINSTTQTVGSADYWGVYTLPTPSDALPHALGPFSVHSTGLFGFPQDCSLTPPQLTVRCEVSRPTLHRGDVLLLQIE